MKKNCYRSCLLWISLIFCSILLTLSHCSRESDLEKGITALEKGDYLNAVRTLNVSLIADSLNPEIHYNLSLAYAHLDSLEKAQIHFLKLLSFDSLLAENIRLKEVLACKLGIDPYPSISIPMARMHLKSLHKICLLLAIVGRQRIKF